MNTPEHNCPFCEESLDDLTVAANMLAKLLTRPQIIGHNAKSRAAQYKGARRDLDAINTCSAIRHLKHYPRTENES